MGDRRLTGVRSGCRAIPRNLIVPGGQVDRHAARAGASQKVRHVAFVRLLARAVAPRPGGYEARVGVHFVNVNRQGVDEISKAHLHQ